MQKGILKKEPHYELKKLQEARAEWIESQRERGKQRDANWAEAVAIGSREFVEEVKAKLGMRAKARNIRLQNEGFVLKETTAPYRPQFNGKKVLVREENLVYLNE
jgi:putative transposase